MGPGMKGVKHGETKFALPVRLTIRLPVAVRATDAWRLIFFPFTGRSCIRVHDSARDRDPLAENQDMLYLLHCFPLLLALDSMDYGVAL